MWPSQTDRFPRLYGGWTTTAGGFTQSASTGQAFAGWPYILRRGRGADRGSWRPQRALRSPRKGWCPAPGTRHGPKPVHAIAADFDNFRKAAMSGQEDLRVCRSPAPPSKRNSLPSGSTISISRPAAAQSQSEEAMACTRRLSGAYEQVVKCCKQLGVPRFAVWREVLIRMLAPRRCLREPVSATPRRSIVEELQAWGTSSTDGSCGMLW